MTESAARAATVPTVRRVAQVVLAVGIVLAVGAGFGPVWAARVGIVVAVLAGALACRYAWREASMHRVDGADALLTAAKEHGAALSAEREHNAGVLQVLTDRNEAVRGELATTRTELTESQREAAGLRGTITTLRRDLNTSRLELAEREATIDVLRETVAARETELRVLRAEDGDLTDAEVHAWPRHLSSDAPEAEVSTVVDLRTDASAETSTPSSSYAPNYEPQSGLA